MFRKIFGKKPKRILLICRGCGRLGAGNDGLCDACRYLRRRDVEEGHGWHIA